MSHLGDTLLSMHLHWVSWASETPITICTSLSSLYHRRWHDARIIMCISSCCSIAILHDFIFLGICMITSLWWERSHSNIISTVIIFHRPSAPTNTTINRILTNIIHAILLLLLLHDCWVMVLLLIMMNTGCRCGP